MPVRRLEPVYVPSRASKYSTYHDYGIDDSINRADYLSNAVLEDTYEAAARSRGKDHALLRNLNAAIPNYSQQAFSLSRTSASLSTRSVLTSVPSSETRGLRPQTLYSQPLPSLAPRKTEPLQSPLRSPTTPTSVSSLTGSSVKIPAYYAAGGDPNNLPVSELRRKLRRTIARAKNNPDYYRQ